MPRLLPTDFIKQKAIYHLLELYKKETEFVREWSEVRNPHLTLLEQFTKVFTLYQVMDMVGKVPHDLIVWELDRQRLERHLQGQPPCIRNPRDLRELAQKVEEVDQKLAPYKEMLARLADKWNMRATWAGDKLFWEDVNILQEKCFKAARVTSMDKLSQEQITAYLRYAGPNMPILPFEIATLFLYEAGGRRGATDLFARVLTSFEQCLKASGMKEVPSALPLHASWWFDHYVRAMEFREIGDRIASSDPQGGPHVENIRKAVIRFSVLISIHPAERSKR